MSEPRLMQKHEVIDSLHAFVKKFPTRKAATAKLKCTEAQLSTTLNDKTDVIPARILKAMGLQTVLVYVSNADAKKLGKRKPKTKNVPAEEMPASTQANHPTDSPTTAPSTPSPSATASPPARLPVSASPRTPEPTVAVTTRDSVISVRD